MGKLKNLIEKNKAVIENGKGLIISSRNALMKSNIENVKDSIFFVTFAYVKPDAFLYFRMNFQEILDPEFRKEIASSQDLKRFPAGSVILDIDSYVNYIPLVLSGSVKVVRTEQDGREILLYYLKPGESCISSILSGLTQGTSKVKAVAEEDTEILMLSLTKAKEWLTKYPEWSAFVFELYQKRFEDLVHMVNAVAFQKVDARILYLLHQKSQLYKSKELSVTHQKLADELGITREAVSRVLKQIETEGKIKLSRNKITLL